MEQQLPVATTTMMENPSTVEESEMGMKMEKLGTSSFLLDADQKLEPNTNETAAVAALFSLHSVEELPPPTCKLQSSASLACKEEPSPAAASKLKLHSNTVFGGGASNSNLQKLNESTGGSGSGDGHCYDSGPIPPLRGQALDHTSSIWDLFLKHGPQQQQQHDDERVQSSSELPSEANEDVRTSSAAAASHKLFFLPSIPFYNLDRSESSRTLDDDAHEEKLSATTTTTDKSSDSSRWTSATLESPLSLPDPDQELSVSITTTTGPCINEKIFNPNTQKQHVPSVAEKVTEEQLTEAAFLSNLGFSKETMRCASSEDVHQTHVSPTNRTNAFRSKSTGRRTVKPTAAVREDPGSAVANSNSEQEVKYPYVRLKKSSLDFFVIKEWY
jgi:hypothetical protein